MPIRIPSFIGLPPATRAELQQVLRELDALYREGAVASVDGRQTIRAGHRRVEDLQRAINPRDAVPLAQVQSLLTQLETRLRKELAGGKAQQSFSASDGGGIIVPPPSTLPAPNHRMNFGYYFPEYVAQGFDGWVDVALTVNTYYCVVRSAYCLNPTSSPPSQWVPAMASYVQRAYNAGKRLHVLFEYDHADVRPFIDQVLDALTPFWDRILSIEIADEPRNPDGTYMNEIQFNALAADFNSKLSAHNLSTIGRAFSVSLSPDEALDSAIIDSDAVDRVGANLYLDFPSSGDPATEVAKLDNFIDDFVDYATNATPPKEMHFTMMAFDRNGFYNDVPSLVALQSRYYLKAYQNPKVRALYAFSYGRERADLGFGATHYHPELRAPHIAIYNAIHPLD